MAWIGNTVGHRQPFFLYLPTNCPHGPFGDVPQISYAYHKEQKITADQFSKTDGNPIPRNMDADTQARVYAMIENIDGNVGRGLTLDQADQLNERWSDGQVQYTLTAPIHIWPEMDARWANPRAARDTWMRTPIPW